MTDREFKRLSRAELIDVIYQLQLQNNELNEEKQALACELEDKRIRLRNAGNIADAAMEIHHVMQAAQDAASHYLEEIRIMRDETEEKCRRLLENARKEADEILAQAKRRNTSNGFELEEIVKEFGPKR